MRYVVQSKDASKTIVRIDAIFVEDFRHTVHASDGSVENAECQDIQDHIDAVEAEKKQTEEGEKQRQEKLAKQHLNGRPKGMKPPLSLPRKLRLKPWTSTSRISGARLNVSSRLLVAS